MSLEIMVIKCATRHRTVPDKMIVTALKNEYEKYQEVKIWEDIGS